MCKGEDMERITNKCIDWRLWCVGGHARFGIRCENIVKYIVGVHGMTGLGVFIDLTMVG